jgi:signal transduction histidine kinase
VRGIENTTLENKRPAVSHRGRLVGFAVAVLPASAAAATNGGSAVALLAAVVVGALLALAAVALARRQRSRRRIAALRQSLAASVAWWWEADPEGRVVAVEAGHRQLEGLDGKRLLGRRFWQLDPGASPPAALSSALATRAGFADVAIEATDGSIRHRLALSGAPLFSGGGRFVGYSGTVRALPAADSTSETAPTDVIALQADLEERNRQLAERTRELEHAARELDSFSHSVSHDLRAPLRVVDGFATIVLEDYGDRGKPLDDLGRDHLRRIVAASQRMNTMIDTLLNLSRMTSRELARERVDLSQITRELSDDLRAQDATRAVEFVVAAGLKADGDPTLLRLVLQNLLGNAFKFSARNRGARIEFGCRDDSGKRVYFVRDNGAGFDMRFAQKLFGMYQRLHSASEFPGTGVGLATVQKIVRRHGGRVWAESVPAPAEGHGATFYFTLWEAKA